MKRLRPIDIALLLVLLVMLYTSFIEVSRGFRITVAVALGGIYLLTLVGERGSKE